MNNSKVVAALHEFVDAVTVTGGVIRNRAGLHEPAADRSWIDIGEAYVNACAVLGVPAQIYPKIYLDDEVEPPEQWCVELDAGSSFLYRFTTEEHARAFVNETLENEECH